MHKNSEVFKSLNQLLQGEYMAVESFNVFISKLDDENTKNCFQSIQKQHRENIDILAEYIQDNGGQPHENIGLKGKMADIKLDMGLGSNKSKVINKALEGETEGINMAEKVLRGTLDDNSRIIAGQILQNDRASIDKIRNLSSS
ncbi:DUF2383 domain-containing protein [Alkalibaculum sp. M08DMB]|uniref:DUF2383 domain-containing protein n=1 Tax=Alkalibaculum sporogenes TaxID=2655001 RepID=A0A6A7KDB7_9FIRM|nr:DUF2383 domain-containing protein [Alkalibaculum sporogenes]